MGTFLYIIRGTPTTPNDDTGDDVMYVDATNVTYVDATNLKYAS
jgi:hypothetical protein